MSSRDVILGAIRRNRPAQQSPPGSQGRDSPPPDDSLFTARAGDAGATVVICPTGLKGASLLRDYPEGIIVGSMVDEVHGTVEITPESDVQDLARLGLFVCRGAFGVDENGAIWLPESLIGHRAAPFLAQHLAIVLTQRSTVATMHDAYARLGKSDVEPFGVFVAGPSKTADIEQALVHGAHGPRTLRILLV